MDEYFSITPDYQNSVISVTASIQKHFGIETNYPTVPELDLLLEGNYQNVVLLILDGLGSDTLSEHLSTDCFLSRHKLKDLSSVFPSSTVPATTSIRTGLSPREHGLIGSALFNIINGKTYKMFRDYQAAADMLQIKPSASKIKNGKYYELSPFQSGMFRAEQLQDIAQKLPELCLKRGKKFIYAYTNEPDKSLHDYGLVSSEAHRVIEGLNNFLETFRRQLNDTLLIIVADHGLTELNGCININNVPGLIDTLSYPEAVIDPRCAGFYVKEGEEDTFCRIVTEAIGDKGVLLTRAQAENYFGVGLKNPAFDLFCGEYVAIMTSDIAIWHEDIKYKATHGGMTKRELVVPLITASCPKLKMRK